MTTRTGLTVAIGRWSARHRKSAVFGWLLFVVFATMAGTMAGSVKTTDVDNGVGESGRAARILDEAGLSRSASEVVFLRSGSFTADDPRFRSAVDAVSTAVRRTGRTANIRSPYTTGAVSADRHAALVKFDMTGDADTAADRVKPVLDAVASTRAAHPGIRIEEFGDAGAKKAYQDVFADDFAKAEWTAVPLALGILLVVFGALVAAVLPVVLALTAFVAAAGLLAVSSHWVHTTADASSVMLLVGLAVGVDYCLFYLRREREERAAGNSAEAALTAAAATSGRSVLVSGFTVVVAMAGMFLTGMAYFTAMATATILVVVVAVLGSVTVLPALLSMLGDRVERGRVPLVGRARRRAAARGGGRVWNAVLRRVLDHPAGATVASLAVLLALAAPLVTMKTAQISVFQDLPQDNAAVQTEHRIAQAFPGDPVPASVVVHAPDVTGPGMTAAIAALQRQALATGRMHGPVTVTLHARQGIAVVDIPVAGTGTDHTSEVALRALRGTVVPRTVGAVPGAQVAVTGVTAMSVDFSDRVGGSVLPVFAFVLALAFLLMLFSFRSVVIAATTVVLNLLSVGAAYGALVLVFQRGVGSSLLGTRAMGSVASWLPLFLFVILFGLSMDYHVFVVSRIKEGHDRGLSTRDAVARGISGTAGVVTSAAVIMVGVFAIFGTLSVVSTKEIGIGLAVAVLVDATVIRAILLPAAMALLGERNWYLPRALRWIPESTHGEAPVAAPARPRLPERV